MRVAPSIRCGFTLVELVVVIMILGILAAIGAPRFLDTADRAVDNGLRQTLGVVRDAIDRFMADHEGKLPGADGQEQTFKDDLTSYLRGNEFPECPVGAKLSAVRMVAGTDASIGDVSGTQDAFSWAYKYETGDFRTNSDTLSADGATKYSQF